MIGGALGAALAMVLLAGATAPAQAAPGNAPAPAGAQSLGYDSPGISPPAERIRHVGLAGDYDCPTGRACFAVWDPVLLKYKVFDLYHCRLYSLSFWYGMGSFSNAQTGGAAVVLHGQNGPLPGSYPPTGSGAYYQLNWDPVWKIKPC
jgi:hypothetical protein